MANEKEKSQTPAAIKARERREKRTEKQKNDDNERARKATKERRNRLREQNSDSSVSRERTAQEERIVDFQGASTSREGQQIHVNPQIAIEKLPQQEELITEQNEEKQTHLETTEEVTADDPTEPTNNQQQFLNEIVTDAIAIEVDPQIAIEVEEISRPQQEQLITDQNAEKETNLETTREMTTDDPAQPTNNQQQLPNDNLIDNLCATEQPAIVRPQPATKRAKRTDVQKSARAKISRRERSHNSNSSTERMDIQQIQDIMPQKVIQGGFNQGNARFGETAGSQCTAIAFFAAIYHQIKTITRWDSSDINSVLQNGDALYKDIIVQIANDMRYLSMDELPPQVQIDNLNVLSEVFIADNVFQLTTNETDKSYELCSHIEQCKSETFNNAALCIFGTKTLLFLYPQIANPPLYVFDSHSRNNTGQTCPDGTAVVMKFQNAREAVTFLFNEHPTETYVQVGFPKFEIPELNRNQKQQILRRFATEEKRQKRLEEQRVRQQLLLETETAEQRQVRKQDMRNRTQNILQQETEQEREVRLYQQRVQNQNTLHRETQEERQNRLNNLTIRNRERREEETEEDYSSRLEQQRVRDQNRVQSESVEQKAERLRQKQVNRKVLQSRETLDEQLSREMQQRTNAINQRRQETDEARTERLNKNARRHAMARKWTGQLLSAGYLLRPKEAFNYDPQKRYAEDPGVVIGEMSLVCIHCNAKKFAKEPPGMCCSGGKVQLEPLRPPPEPLASMLTNQLDRSARLLNSIRKYNSIFHMTSFGSLGGNIVNDQWQSTFKMSGQVYHRVGQALIPPQGRQEEFLQIYFIQDLQEQCNRRCSIIDGLDRTIVYELQNMLHDENQFVRQFKTAMERSREVDNYQIVVRGDPVSSAREHPGRLNAPTNPEVAILMVGNPASTRDIVLNYREGVGLRKISELNQFYDSMQYPLMFATGQGGYHIKIPTINPVTGEQHATNTVTCNDFYAYRFMMRVDEINYLLLFRELFHQFATDAYSKTEKTKLDYIRNNQKKMRVANHKDLVHAIETEGCAVDTGKIIVLPPSFTGGPRYMAERHQDGISMVHQFGKPDLFITMTCNQNWPEIKASLYPNQHPSHRHDIIARVFRQKVIALLNVIVKGQIFGSVQGYMYTVEWQKRGLPHVHLLLWLHEKIRPCDVDNVISAEIPSPDDEDLYKTVTECMVHGPCGYRNPDSPCMVNKRCKAHYERSFNEVTRTDANAYPQYMRRSPEQGGRSATINRKKNNQSVTYEIDNRNIVPYSPLLCKLFNAHINVESCVSINSIKYICAYINKGSDLLIFQILKDQHKEGEHDEITAFLKGRYISSNEALWKLFGFPIHERYPSVVLLSVHEEGQESVCFQENQTLSVNKAAPLTNLTAFFKLCREDNFAASLLYPEVPRFYVWDEKNKQWTRRKQGIPVEGHPDIKETETIARVYAISPRNAECYFLRMLLHVIPGPTSFEALRTVNDVICASYRETCQLLGLLEDDAHWDKALTEAAIGKRPKSLRYFFATLLIFCNVSDARKLWENHKDALSEDILRDVQRRYPGMPVTFFEGIYNEALREIEDKVLYLGGDKLHSSTHQLPEVQRNELNRSLTMLMRETLYDAQEMSRAVENGEPTLTEEQLYVYEKVLDSVQNQSGDLFFLDAPGGTGKTYLLNLILCNLRRNRNVAIAVASSGIAATLLDNGRTAHSAFKLPLHLERGETLKSTITRNSDAGALLRETRLIVWDESTMSNKKAFENVDLTLRDLRKNEQLNGGVTVLLAGDFRQTLPVVPRGTRADAIDASIKSSTLWGQAEQLKLTVNMRALLQGDAEAEEFSRQLLAIGEGRLETVNGLSVLPCGVFVRALPQLIDAVFPNMLDNYTNSIWMSERAILCPTNDGVNAINELLLAKLPGDSVVYRSFDTVSDDLAVNFPVEFLNTLNPSGLPQQKLNLKIGAPVILLRNLDPPRLCNGTRLIIRNLHANVVDAEILMGPFAGERVFIPRVPLTNDEMTFEFTRLQFPLKLCFALTINKAQGQTMTVVGIDLRQHCFSHGQLYVACSRVGRSGNIYILSESPGRTVNVVYPEALQ